MPQIFLITATDGEDSSRCQFLALGPQDRAEEAAIAAYGTDCAWIVACEPVAPAAVRGHAGDYEGYELLDLWLTIQNATERLYGATWVGDHYWH